MDLNEDQIKLIKKVAEENGFQKFEIDVKPGSNKGDNFLGIIKRITIKDAEKKLTVIMKLAQSSEVLRNLQPTRSYFLREMHIYEKVFKEYAAFEEEHNIPNKFLAQAKVLGICDIDKSESLIFEDLNERQFLMCDKKNTMNAEHIKAVLKEYAKIHSIAIAMRHKEPERFRNISKLVEKDVHDGQMNEEHFNQFMKAIIDNMFKAVEDDVIATEALKKYLEYLKNEWKGRVRDEDNVVIVHGDCWCNNFLFKYQDGNKEKPSDVCIIDWQLSRLGSPGLDLSYFLFVNASKEILDDYKTYLKLYHDEVCQNLKDFSCDPEELFPYEFMEYQFDKYSKDALVICTLIMRILACDSEEAPDIQEAIDSGKTVDDIINFELNNVDEYKRRLSIIIQFMIKNELF